MDYVNDSLDDSIEVDGLNNQELQENINSTNIKNNQLTKEYDIFFYKVESLKDDYQELEEKYNRLQKDFVKKSHIYEYLTRDYNKLKDEYDSMKELSSQIDKLIEEHGLLDEETMMMLKDIEGNSLEDKLNKIFDERNGLTNEIKKLQTDLNEERKKNQNLEELFSINDEEIDSEDKFIENQKDNNKVIYEYKFQLKKAKQELDSLQNSIARSEAQLNRYKQLNEEAELTEDKLKSEKRKLLKDFRDAQEKIDELETENSHLQKRIEKLKNDRLAIINQN